MAHLKELHITECNALTSLVGVPSLPELESLHVLFCSRLASFAGLPALPQLQYLTVHDCPALSDAALPALPTLPALKVLALSELNGIVDLQGFPAVGPNALLNFNNMGSLSSLAGLALLTACRGIWITHCDALLSLDGLQNLDTVPYQVLIVANQQLTDITALSPQSRVGRVSIRYNPSLDQCRALAHVLTWFQPITLDIAGNGSCVDAGATQ
jgi:hypothetical protein